MKLNINAKELLALYNTLYEKFDGVNGRDLDDYREDDPRANDAVQLKQVYNRLRAILIAGLTNPGKQLDPIESWLNREQVKIDKLSAENEALKEVAKSPESLVGILTDDDDEIPGDLAYPKKKGPPNPQMPHGKFKGKKR